MASTSTLAISRRLLWLAVALSMGVCEVHSSAASRSPQTSWLSRWKKTLRQTMRSRDRHKYEHIPEDIAAVVDCSSRYYLAEILHDSGNVQQSTALHHRRKQRKLTRTLRRALWVSPTPSSSSRMRGGSSVKLQRQWDLPHEEELDAIYDDILILETQLRLQLQSQPDGSTRDDAAAMAGGTSTSANGNGNDIGMDIHLSLSSDYDSEEGSLDVDVDADTDTDEQTRQFETQLSMKQLYHRLEDLQNRFSTLQLYCGKVRVAVDFTNKQAKELRLELGRRVDADRAFLDHYETQVQCLQNDTKTKLQNQIHHDVHNIYQPQIAEASQRAYHQVVATMPHRMTQVVDALNKETQRQILEEQHRTMQLVATIERQRHQVEKAMATRLRQLKRRKPSVESSPLMQYQEYLDDGDVDVAEPHSEEEEDHDVDTSVRKQVGIVSCLQLWLSTPRDTGISAAP